MSLLTTNSIPSGAAKIRVRREAVLKAVMDGETDVAIANRLGEHITQVRIWRVKAGLQHNAACKYVGDAGEQLVLAKCLSLGLSAELMPPKWPYDLTVNGWRVEVKTAAKVITKTDPRQGSSVKTLAFNIGPKRVSLHGHSYEKDYSADCDFVIAVWLKNDPVIWVIPIALLPRTNLWIQVSGYPGKRSKYAKLENAFGFLEGAA